MATSGGWHCSDRRPRLHDGMASLYHGGLGMVALPQGVPGSKASVPSRKGKLYYKV